MSPAIASTAGASTAALLRLLWLPELKRHAARHASALLAVALGVALAFSVHLINASALAEFGAAVRGVQGEPDLELRADAGLFDESAYALLAVDPRIALASPLLEVETLALTADGKRVPIRVLGIDALVAPQLSPDLLPRPALGSDRLASLDPHTLFLNPAARAALGPPNEQRELRLQSGLALVALRDGGDVGAAGAPLAVLDIAGVQALFDRVGRLSRVDLRLAEGVDRAALRTEVQARLGERVGPGLRLVEPGSSQQRLSNVSRAYRVNLTVLALVALFTGAFLVYAVMWLSVAQRTPAFALLSVLGLDAAARRRLVLAEATVIGSFGSLIGLALGTLLAALALRLLGGDLGGGYFSAAAPPPLQWSAPAAALYALLGCVAALLGAWLPARAAERLAPARALKGLGGPHDTHASRRWLGPALLATGVLLALLPPIGDLPLAAYAGVALLLLGGIASIPLLVQALLPESAPRSPLTLLAVERVRHDRATTTVAISGLVASLALAVALTVMVGSFRRSVMEWLDVVLPAELYVRSATASGNAETVWLPPEFVRDVAVLPGVARLQAQRVRPLTLDPARPAPALIARELDDPARALPLTGTLLPARDGRTSIYVSEAMVALYGAAPGTELALPLRAGAEPVPVFVRGVWRDYARQHGAIAMDRGDYRRLSGDDRVNDLALNLQPGTDVPVLQQSLSALARRQAGAPAADLLEFARADQIRALSLRIFDRSFAVTYWLQAVAIGIGLVGVAASVSAQVLARRREFGLLRHLGFSRAQVLGVVAGESALWSLLGALLGVLLGLAVSVVLVKVVNPQSFHWTMEMHLPGVRLALLAAAVALAGTASAVLAARHAVRQDAVLAVREDW